MKLTKHIDKIFSELVNMSIINDVMSKNFEKTDKNLSMYYKGKKEAFQLVIRDYFTTLNNKKV